MLHPVLSPYRIEVRLHKPDKWFLKLDLNKDKRIDIRELALYLTNLNFKEKETLFKDLKSQYYSFLNSNWVLEEEKKEYNTPLPSFEVIVAEIDLIQPQGRG